MSEKAPVFYPPQAAGVYTYESKGEFRAFRTHGQPEWLAEELYLESGNWGDSDSNEPIRRRNRLWRRVTPPEE